MRINLPPQLYQEVHRLLLALDVCENYSALKGRLTAVNELNPFANTLPKRENPKAQTDALIAHLHDRQTAVSQQNALVFFLRHLATGISEQDRYRVELEETAQALEAEMAYQQRWLERCNPYRGLEAFQEEHERLFFGREIFTQQLLERVKETNFVAVIGASGSGKSSVVRAGLLPVLRRTGQWQLITLRPSENPFRALAQAMIPAEVQGEPRLRQAQSLQHGWVQGELTLDDVMVNSLTPLPQDRLLLFVDQFEELFTLCPDRDTQHRFIDLLLSGLKNPACTVLLTMRADFMGQATAYRPLADTLHTYPSMILGPMNTDELQQAIAEPATSLGIRFETGLAERILDDVQDEPGNLPLLQFALTELWDDQKTDFTHYTLKQDTYTQMGKVQGALTQYADKVYASLTPDQQQEARHIFTQLVQPGLGTEDTRKRATIDEIGAERWPLVQQLANKRLIVTNKSENTQQAEVAHEALIAQWGQLQAWMNEDRAFRVWQERLRQNLKQWQDKEKDEALLLPKSLLGEAERWLEDKQDELQPVEVDFINLSGDYHQQNEKRRRRLAIGVTAVSIFIALSFAWLAFDRSDQAQTAINAQATSQISEGIAQENLQIAQTEVANSATSEALTLNEANARATAQAIAEFNEQEAQNQAIISESMAWSARATQFEIQEPRRYLLWAWYSAWLLVNNDHETIESTTDSLYNALNSSLHKGILDGHLEGVVSATFSPDGERILTASADDTAILWNIQGQPIAVMRGHTDSILSATFSPDGERILTASVDNTAILWNIQGQPIAVMRGHTDRVRYATFSPNREQILTASADGTAILWDFKANKLVTFQHEASVGTAVFSPDGQQILTASWDKTAILWDLTGDRIAILEDHTDFVESALFSPDGEKIITTSFDKTAKLWNTQGDLLATLQGHTAIIKSATFSPDGNYIVTVSLPSFIDNDNRAIVWSNTGDMLTILEGHTDSVISATFSPNSKMILTGSRDNTVKLWDIAGNSLFTLEGHTGSVNSVAFSPDGRQVLTSGGGLGSLDDNTARLWNIANHTWFSVHESGIRQAKFLPNSERFLTINWNSPESKIWTLDGNLSFTLTGHTDAISSIAFSPDGSQIVTAGEDNATYEHDGKARLWNLDGSLITTLIHHTRSVDLAIFSPDGSQIATLSSDNAVRIWGLEGELIAILEGHTEPISSIVFSPDGNQIATASYNNGVAKIWNIEGDLIAILEGHTESINSMAFSPDGNQIATASSDNTIRLWTNDGKLTKILQGHTSHISSVAFSPNSNFIITGSGDNTARLWDKLGNSIAILSKSSSLERPNDSISSVSFSPNGQYILILGTDNIAQVWLMWPTVRDMLLEAERRLRLIYTKEECLIDLPEEACSYLFDVGA